MDVSKTVQSQRDYFYTDITKSYEFRLDALKRLETAMHQNEGKLFDALQADLGKSEQEAYMTEVGLTYGELRHAIKNLKKWMKPKKVGTPLAHFPSRSVIHSDPYGVVLVMSPWNYPFFLTMVPVIGAIAAGNCVVVKPSNYSPATSQAIADLLQSCYPENYVATILGGREQNQDLLKQTFDYIFFTGGLSVGRVVMESAIPNLTPITLELGGKSPCIVDKSAPLPLAARRIAFGKFTNTGQTCVAPDYLLVHSSQKDELASHLKKEIIEMYGEDTLQNGDYPHIVNKKHFDRLLGLMEGANILQGGKSDRQTLKIQPTLLDGVTWDSPVMGEEIFGPLFPILTYDTLDEVIATVNSHPKPLALYLFTTDRAVEQRILTSVSYGGGCINDTIIHLANPQLPFGGVGYSGMGCYHGKDSFDTFTHYKSVLKKANWLDISMRYAPYTKKKYDTVRRFVK
ncbi:aldehyde dehydrogenase [Christensenellaceae bacterium OttesenSCG-928-K19]|nr:aldehyde dehydrogenase [Christensenellaceae bacterium OttesenSCG-928-K19]